LTIVVADNNGGGIFSSLEQGDSAFASDFERVFGTPHDLDLEEIARATGISTTVVQDAQELTAALDEPSVGVNIIIAKTVARDDEQAQWADLLRGR